MDCSNYVYYYFICFIGQIENVAMMTDYNGDPYSFVKYRYPGSAKRALLASTRGIGLRTRNDTVLSVRPRAYNNSGSVKSPITAEAYNSEDQTVESNGEFEKQDQLLQNQKYSHPKYEEKFQHQKSFIQPYGNITQKSHDLNLSQYEHQFKSLVEVDSQAGLETSWKNINQLPDSDKANRMAPLLATSFNIDIPAIPFRTVLVCNIPEPWSAQDLYSFYHGSLYTTAGPESREDTGTFIPQPMIVVGVFLYANNQRMGLVEFADHAMAYSACENLGAGPDDEYLQFNDRKVVPTDIWSLDAWLGGVQKRSGSVIQTHE